MLDGLPGTAPTRRSTVRSAALVTVVAATALGVVALLGIVFGVFSGFSFSGAASAGGSVAAGGASAAGLEPAPALPCAGAPAAGAAAGSTAAAAAAGSTPAAVAAGSTSGAFSSSVRVSMSPSGAGEDTPLAAAQAWLGTVAHHDELVQVREFAAAPPAVSGARTLIWYDHDGAPRAEATVVPAPDGRWQLTGAATCS